MMSSTSSIDELEYYGKRARCERELAEAAVDPRAASSHAALADRYEALVASGEPPTALILTPMFQKGWTNSQRKSRNPAEAEAEC